MTTTTTEAATTALAVDGALTDAADMIAMLRDAIDIPGAITPLVESITAALDFVERESAPEPSPRERSAALALSDLARFAPPRSAPLNALAILSRHAYHSCDKSEGIAR